MDPFVRSFDCRVLIQNRRVVDDPGRRDELESFHETLNDISAGKPTELVKKFLIECYVRAAKVGADNVEFEGSTAVFTKRRYRDRWNRTVTRRVAKRHTHCLKVKVGRAKRSLVVNCTRRALFHFLAGRRRYGPGARGVSSGIPTLALLA